MGLAGNFSVNYQVEKMKRFNHFRTIMRRSLLAALLGLAMVGVAESLDNLVDGRYVSPLGNYMVAAPDWTGLVVQQYNDADFTNVAFLDQGGMLPASMWGIASLRLDAGIMADLEAGENPEVVYQRFLEFFVLPHMLQNVAPKAALSHATHMGGDAPRALFAVASIPQGHAFLRNPKRNKQDDSVCGLLVFHHGTFIYLLRAEMRTITNPSLTFDKVSEKDIEAAQTRLQQIREKLKFPE